MIIAPELHAAKRSSMVRPRWPRRSLGRRWHRHRRVPSATACRRSATSNIRQGSSISTTSIQTPPRAACFPMRGDPGVQSELSHLQFAQYLHPQGRRRAGHGVHLRELNGARRRRAGRPLRACRAGGADIRGRAHLPFPDAAGITFHDGSPLTAHDVAFSLKILKEKGHPIAQQMLRDFVGAEATDDATVLLRFAPHRARGLQGTRPGDPYRSLLGSALAQGLALAGLLGRVRPARDKTAVRARCPRHLVVRSRKRRVSRSSNASLILASGEHHRARHRLPAVYSIALAQAGRSRPRAGLPARSFGGIGSPAGRTRRVRGLAEACDLVPLQNPERAPISACCSSMRGRRIGCQLPGSMTPLLPLLESEFPRGS
jgi:hypothetical protein